MIVTRAEGWQCEALTEGVIGKENSLRPFGAPPSEREAY